MDNLYALYDITGIQNYIYKNTRLKTIIGASKLVAGIFDVGKHLLTDKSHLVYSGGGNAVFSFPNQDAWRFFNAIFSRKILLCSPGLNFVTVCESECEKNTTSNFSERIDRLFTSIAVEKDKSIDRCFFDTLPPMAQCTSDKNQVVMINTNASRGDDSGASDFSWEHWKKYETGQTCVDRNDPYKEFDNIAEPPCNFPKAERLMAIVHIDGNNMGKIFSSAFKSVYTPEDACAFSKSIADAFKGAYEKMTGSFENIPIREIYINGDDVTYVCNAAYGLTSAVKFMEALQEYRTDLLAELSASAGIAYIKPHYPFSDGYDMAEKCCKNAKDTAKFQIVDKKSLDIGCWLDFAVIRASGFDKTLSDQHFRPYLACKANQNFLEDHSIEDLIDTLNVMNGLPRSLLKDLRNAYLFGDKEAVLLRIKSAENECLINRPLLVFDALDIMDVERCGVLCGLK